MSDHDARLAEAAALAAEARRNADRAIFWGQVSLAFSCVSLVLATLWFIAQTVLLVNSIVNSTGKEDAPRSAQENVATACATTDCPPAATGAVR